MDARIAELVALVIIVLCAVHGKNKGLFMQLFSLVRIILLVVLTFFLAELILPYLPDYLPNRSGIAYTAAGILAIIVLAFVNFLSSLISKIPVIGTLDWLGGLLVGIVIGVLIDWVAVVVLVACGDMAWAKQAADAIHDSEVLSKLLQLNIFS